MRRKYNGQRQHFIHSLHYTVLQLQTLSFFLSPSLWTYFLRMVFHTMLRKPREFDGSRSLRFFFILVVGINFPCLWKHANPGVPEGRAIVLDFIGLAYVPTSLQLLSLDFLIIFLQLVLTTIIYETSLLQSSMNADMPDMLLPDSFSSLPTSPLSIPNAPNLETPLERMPILLDPGKDSPINASPYIVDLQLRPILVRLRDPPSNTRTQNSNTYLPLPNTSPWPLPSGMRMLMRARAQMRDTNNGIVTASGNDPQPPGSLDTQDR